LSKEKMENMLHKQMNKIDEKKNSQLISTLREKSRTSN